MIVACVKVGTKYGPEYVNRLASMVARNTSRPYQFLCLTDDPTGLTCATAPIGTGLPGWWAKLVLFKPHPKLKDQRVVFLDLDAVIVDNIDFLLDYDGPFAVLQDFNWPANWGSGCMSLAPGFGQQVWDKFTEYTAEMFPGDQEWVQWQVKVADLWQDLYPKKMVSYKVDQCEQGVPTGAAIVHFHGVPKPDELLHIPWLAEAWQ